MTNSALFNITWFHWNISQTLSFPLRPEANHVINTNDRQPNIVEGNTN